MLAGELSEMVGSEKKKETVSKRVHGKSPSHHSGGEQSKVPWPYLIEDVVQLLS